MYLGDENEISGFGDGLDVEISRLDLLPPVDPVLLQEGQITDEPGVHQHRHPCTVAPQGALHSRAV